MIKRAFLLIFTLIFAITLSLGVSAKSYPDVLEDALAYEAVDYLSDIGVVAGYEDGLFLPDKEITRGEAATLLARTLGYEESYEIKEMPFEDVKSGYWAERFISFCWEGGLVNGMSETSFAPADKVTYAQMIKMLVCAAGLENNANENKGDKWYDGYIKVADGEGITSDVEISPDESAPRGDVAVLVYNCVRQGLICNEEADEPYEDTKDTEDIEETDETEEDEEDAEETEKEKPAPVVAYKEDVVKTVKVPEDFEFADGIDYTPEFDISEVDFSDLEEVSREESLLVVIDPGHNFSGTDVGAHNEEYEVWEQNITWPVAEMLRLKLEMMGFEVVMTRDNYNDNITGSSVKEALLNRAGIANGLEADLFISIHCNAGGGEGVETYCYQKGTRAEKLAKAVQEELADRTELVDRGVKTAGFVVIKETVMPAILIETAFIDTESDFNFLISRDGQNKLSTAIARGVYEYATSDSEE